MTTPASTTDHERRVPLQPGTLVPGHFLSGGVMAEPADAGHNRGRAGDEPLRGLAAPGPSKVGTEAAMRARDVSRVDVAARQSSRPQSGQAQTGQAQTGQNQSVGAEGSSGSSPVDS